MIKTKEFLFTKRQYFGILLKSSLRRNLWAFVFLVILVLYQATKGFNNLLLILSGLLMAYFLYLTIRCWIHASSKRNKLFFAARTFEIDDRSMTITFPEGPATRIEIDRIARVVKNTRYYLLFLSKRQFVYIPLSAFRTNGDIQRFDLILKARKRPAKPGPSG